MPARSLSEVLAESAERKSAAEQSEAERIESVRREQAIRSAWCPVYFPAPDRRDTGERRNWTRHNAEWIARFLEAVKSEGLVQDLLAIDPSEHAPEIVLALLADSIDADVTKIEQGLEEIQDLELNYSWAVRAFNNNDIPLQILGLACGDAFTWMDYEAIAKACKVTKKWVQDHKDKLGPPGKVTKGKGGKPFFKSNAPSIVEFIRNFAPLHYVQRSAGKKT